MFFSNIGTYESDHDYITTISYQSMYHLTNPSKSKEHLSQA